MHKVDVKHAIRCGLFARRDTIEEAYAVFESVIKNLKPNDRAAVLSAHWIVTNTIAYQLEQNEKIDQKDAA